MSINWRRYTMPLEELAPIIAHEREPWLTEMFVSHIVNSMLNNSDKYPKGMLQYVARLSQTPAGAQIMSRARSLFPTKNSVFMLDVDGMAGFLWVDETQRQAQYEVYFPWPSQRAALEVVNSMLELVFKTYSQGSTIQPRVRYLTFHEPPNFSETNLYVPYLLLLRVSESMDDIQQMFQDLSLKQELDKRALFTNMQLASDITSCAKATADAEEPMAVWLWKDVFGPQASRGFRIDSPEEGKAFLDLEATCAIQSSVLVWMKDILPQQVARRLASQDGDWKTDPKYAAFQLEKGATDPIFQF
jgi:hypothetical protein